jgi:ribosomal protein S6--L-glutamate ligase
LRVCAIIEAGDDPRRNPILGPLRAVLAVRQIDLVAWDPTGAIDLPPAPPPADLYLLKADHQAALAAAACLHDVGSPMLNAFPETAAAVDKPRTLARLARAGLPVPSGRLVGRRNRLGAELASGPRFVKPLRGAHGVGAGVLGPGEEHRAGEGPWLVEEIVGSDSLVLKVYGVGDDAATRRMRFQPGVVKGTREIVPTDPELLRISRRAARAAGLVCWGADFVLGRDGPVLVDLNAFPGYRTVPEAAEWLANAITAELR